jgi:glucosamine 6-phosphate synthetase-like amidotransferase/phosphosugar isomerase protein
VPAGVSIEIMKGATSTYTTQYSIFYAKFTLINDPKGHLIQLLQKTIAQYIRLLNMRKNICMKKQQQ